MTWFPKIIPVLLLGLLVSCHGPPRHVGAVSIELAPPIEEVDPFTHLEWQLSVDHEALALEPIPIAAFMDLLDQLGVRVVEVWPGEIELWPNFSVMVTVYVVTGLTEHVYKFLSTHLWILRIEDSETEFI